MVDPLRMTIIYLRLWKICDIQLSETINHDRARVFEVIPLDLAKLLNDLRTAEKTDLSWAEDADDLRTDIADVLRLATKAKKTERELAALEALRTKFQDNALKYSGDIQIALGGSAR